jgi:hypothetical protein
LPHHYRCPAWLVSWAAAPGELRGAAIIRYTTWDLATSLGSWAFGLAMIALLLLAVALLVRGRRLEQTDVIGLGTLSPWSSRPTRGCTTSWCSRSHGR